MPIAFRRDWSEEAQCQLLAVAGGIMLAATVFTLIPPATEIAVGRGASALSAAALVGVGVGLGAVGVLLLHAWVPHEHFLKGTEGPVALRLGRHWLFILAIAIHNVPEGMSVGVSFAADDLKASLAITAGIGLQNLPEGLAVAAALTGEGYARGRAVLIAALTGLIEPVAGLVGAIAVGLGDALLPWGLAFAAGTMLFVIAGEVIPETHRRGAGQRASLSLVLGFVVMLVLDAAFC